MNKKLKQLHLIGITIGAICIVSTSVFAVNLANKPKEEPKQENNIKVIDEKDIPQLIGEKRVESSSNKLPRERQIELYNQGYDFYDIHKAEELSALCSKTPEELLAVKGKSKDEISNSKEKGTLAMQQNGKTWDEVIKELNIKYENPTEVLNPLDEQKAKMKGLGLSDQQIGQSISLALNYKKENSEVAAEFKKGKTYEQIEKEYIEERNNVSKSRKVPEAVAKENTEKLLKKQYNITEEDIKKCQQNGTTEIVDIAIAKDMANKNNIKLDKVLEIKKSKKNWSEVSTELGGDKVEK